MHAFRQATSITYAFMQQTGAEGGGQAGRKESYIKMKN
jgi:hypothetical protein